jgi:hypothetical protein
VSVPDVRPVLRQNEDGTATLMRVDLVEDVSFQHSSSIRVEPDQLAALVKKLESVARGVPAKSAPVTS